MLNAKIDALQLELDRQAGVVATYIATGKVGSADAVIAKEAVTNLGIALSEAKKELAVLESTASKQSAGNVEYQNVKGEIEDLVLMQNYLAAKTKFDATSAALAQYRQSLTDISYSNNLENDVEYQAAKSKVDSLNAQLASLNERLGSSIVTNPEKSGTVIALAVEDPSEPLPVLPERAKARNVLMMGAIAGIGIAWILLNRRWIAKGMSQQQPIEEDED
jgi:hypothetical protein